MWGIMIVGIRFFFLANLVYFWLIALKASLREVIARGLPRIACVANRILLSQTHEGVL